MAAVSVPQASAVRAVVPTIVSGKLATAPRVLLYSKEKIGKSTFAAGASKPVFLTTENGTDELEIDRLIPHTWVDLMNYLDWLAGSDEFETVVLDTVDWIERDLLFPYVISTCPKGKKSMIEAHGGYGKAYDRAVELWRELLAKLDVLRTQRRMTIVLLAHAHVKKFNDPQLAEGFDTYKLKMHEKGSALLKEWVDAVLFASMEILTVETDGKVRGTNTGARIIYTQPPANAAFDAGNRYNLPETLPLDWAELDAAIKSGREMAKKYTEELLKLIPQLHVDAQAKARAALDQANGNATKIAQLLNLARVRIQETQAKKEGAQ